jgi:CIC family chloride channel protein
MSILHRLRDYLTNLYTCFWVSETVVMVVMALLVGLGGGYGAVAFRWLIDFFQHFFFGTLGDWLSPTLVGRYYVIVVPALGGLLAGLIVRWVAPEVKGSGVSSVLEAIALQGGHIRPIVLVAKLLAASLCIGSGGSAGRAGPIVQIGAAIGSTVSQFFRLSDAQTKNLVACGAAAGIAATFNAPLAGVMFALEVLLVEFGLMHFASVVVASVTASVVRHAHLGDAPAFSVPPHAPISAWELTAFALLGVGAAFAGISFIRVLFAVEDRFDDWSIPLYLKPMVGGLLVGVMGFWFPQVLGLGCGTIEDMLYNRLSFGLIITLSLLKVLVTAFTIGSGGSGGIFAPILFIGALLGGLFGLVIQRWTPGGAVQPTYALVGMAALFGAISRAPMTASLILFELTQDYRIILPLMLSTVTSAVIARSLQEESVYTFKLARRGIDVHAGKQKTTSYFGD